jgi:CRP-like cAMP-binding protein
MNVLDFQSWVQRRDRERREHVPEVERIIPLVQASPGGRTRAEIAGAINLDRDTLSAVLAAFVRSGLLVVRREGGVEVFQTRTGSAR